MPLVTLGRQCSGHRSEFIRRIFLRFILAFFVFFCSYSAWLFRFAAARVYVSLSGMVQPTKEQIEKVISGQMEELVKKVPANSGVSAAFYCPSHPHVKRYYNYGRANDQAEMSEHTIICIGSTTKVFTIAGAPLGT